MDTLATLRSEAAPLTTARETIIPLRWVLILAAGSLLLASHLVQPLTAIDALVIGAFAASNVVLTVAWDRLFLRPAFDILLAVTDTLFLSMAILVADVAAVELLVLCVLTIFLVSTATTPLRIVLSSAAVALLYVWLTAGLRPEGMLLHPAYLVRVPFLYSVALYFRFVMLRAASEQTSIVERDRERQELSVLMDVLETINSCLDLHPVMRTISTKMAQAVGADRCSVVLVEKDGRSLVLASSDTAEVNRLEIDLAKYPEVREAIEAREPVLIDDVQSHPLMAKVRHVIAGAGFNSILVVPMIHQDDLIGTLLLRAASSRSVFDSNVVAFCQAIAGASANALKNALLYRQVKEESARHRATIEKLQNVLHHSMDLIVTTDLEGRITDFNRSAEQALGFSRDEILGQPLTAIYRGAGDKPQFLSLLRKEGEIDQREAALRTRDGPDRVLNLTLSVVRNELGEVVGSVCVGRDRHAAR